MMITIRLQECPIVWLALLDEFFLSFFSFFLLFREICLHGTSGWWHDGKTERGSSAGVVTNTRNSNIYPVYLFLKNFFLARFVHNSKKIVFYSLPLSFSVSDAPHTHHVLYMDVAEHWAACCCHWHYSNEMRLLHQRRVTAICAPCVSLSDIFIIRSRVYIYIFFFQGGGKRKRCPKKLNARFISKPRLRGCAGSNTLNTRENERAGD